MRLWPFRRRTPPPLDQDGPATSYGHHGGGYAGPPAWATTPTTIYPTITYGQQVAYQTRPRVRDWVRERDGDPWRRIGGWR